MIRIAFRNTINNKNQSLTSFLRSPHNRTFSSNGLPVREAGFGKVLVILTPLAVGGGVVAYAKYDNKFRQTLVQNVPAIEPVLKVLLQEEGNALDEATKSISKATQKVGDISNTVTGYFGSFTKSDEPKKEATAAAPSLLPSKLKQSPPPATPTQTSSSNQVAAPPLPTLTAPAAAAPKSATPSRHAAAAPETPKPSAPIPPAKPAALPTNITELERSVEVAAQTAVKEYSKAIQILQSYNEEVKRVVDESIQKVDNSVWSTLKNKTSARDTAVNNAETAAQTARETIVSLERSIAQITKDASPDLVEKLRTHIRSLGDHLNKAKEEMYVAKSSANLSEKFWKNVEASRNYFVEEVEALFPGINLNEKELNLSKENLNLFIIYAHSHVLAYQKELQKHHIEGETRLRRAIEALRGDDPNDALKAQLEFYLEKEKQLLNVDNQKKFFKVKAEAEKELRHQMKLQAAAHSDHLSDALAQKEIELKRVFNRELNEKLTTEQEAYKAQIAAMLGKLKGMDAALKARADADRMVHQAQSLWSACQALYASVRTGDPGISWKHKLRPLANEVSAVGRAAEGDELVTVVLKAVPAEAKTRGVYPEDALRERFIKVEKVARQLAIVPADGARLPIYLLSFIQAALIIKPENPISQEELNNEPIDFSKFDNYDILNRARYWVDRGDLKQALKYMNLLKGASRSIAQDWLKEARLLLETQQAANTLMAHAATSGLSFL